MTRRVTGLSQVDRVRRLLDQRGKQGITQVDFLAPTADGGAPITRVAARINDLKNQGYSIRPCGLRDGCAVYLWAKYLDPAGVVDGAVGNPSKSAAAPLSVPEPLSEESRAAVERGLEQAARGEFAEPPPLFELPAAPPANTMWDSEAA